MNNAPTQSPRKKKEKEKGVILRKGWSTGVQGAREKKLP